jgi:triosephosphate isomerase (TIM)
MRKNIVAGNWKMNLSENEAVELAKEVAEIKVENAQVIIFPPAIFIPSITKLGLNLLVGAQNFYPKDKGAFTGEISITQLKDAGVSHVLVGHSERRTILKEDNEFLKEKVNVALEHGIHVVFCCGEELAIREKGTENEFVKNQLVESIFHLNVDQLKNVTIAYEPIWAIGTGLTASKEQAEAMHLFLRETIASQYSQEVANGISILYGGSCNPSNAKELFACPNVDGGLIGGAALKSADFSSIASSF